MHSISMFRNRFEYLGQQFKFHTQCEPYLQEEENKGICLFFLEMVQVLPINYNNTTNEHYKQTFMNNDYLHQQQMPIPMPVPMINPMMPPHPHHPKTMP
ncbi:hypothetical protein A0J61_11353, partial [Choanephora cucurbitarum]